MTPRAATALGFAGLIPFLWGALTVLVPSLGEAAAGALGARFIGAPVLVGYGTVILCFMGGVLWGFATRAEPELQWKAYGSAVLPPLWAFVMVGGTTASSLSALFVGFFAMLSLDLQFGQWKLTPPWWIGLRMVLTLVTMACLGIGFLFGR